MVPNELATIDQLIGPELGRQVSELAAKCPPAPGRFLELAPDRSHVRWFAVCGQWHRVELRPPPNVIFGDDEDDDDLDDLDEDADESAA